MNPKRKKKSPRKKLKQKLEKLVKDFVKKRDNYTCQHCLKGQLEGANCHASHVIPVSASLRLSYDTLNLKTMCYHCHINWWHKNPTEAGKWFKKKFPDRLTYLNIKKNISTPIKDFELEHWIEELEAL